MAYEAFSSDWGNAFKQAINDSAAYQSAAQSWEWPMALLLTREDGESAGVYLDLYHGTCRNVYPVDEQQSRSATYVLSAVSDVWQSILKGDIDVLSALMSQQILLDKGSVSALASYVVAAHELVECAKPIETIFPD